MIKWRIVGGGLVVLTGLAAGLHGQTPTGSSASPPRSRPFWTWLLGPRAVATVSGEAAAWPRTPPVGHTPPAVGPALTGPGSDLRPAPAGTDSARPTGPAEAALARIRKDEVEARTRQDAVRALGAVDCRYWPEAEAALLASLREDRSESVRLEAALALGRGCCRTRCILEALCVTASGTAEDQRPAEASDRVRSAAALALTQYLAAGGPPGAEGPSRLLDGPAAVGNPHLPLYYRQVEAMPVQRTLEKARRVLEAFGKDRLAVALGNTAPRAFPAAGPTAAAPALPAAPALTPGGPAPQPPAVAQATRRLESLPPLMTPPQSGPVRATGAAFAATSPVGPPPRSASPVPAAPRRRPTVRSVFSQLAGKDPEPAAHAAAPAPTGSKSPPTPPSPVRPPSGGTSRDGPPQRTQSSPTPRAAPAALPSRPPSIEDLYSPPATASRPPADSGPPPVRPGPAPANKTPTPGPIRLASATAPVIPASRPGAPMPPEVQRAVAVLRNAPRSETRQQAAGDLAGADWRASPEVVQHLLLSAYRDPVPAVRVASLRALVNMNANSDLVRIVMAELTTDRDASVRSEAHQAHLRLFPNQPVMAFRDAQSAAGNGPR